MEKVFFRFAKKVKKQTEDRRRETGKSKNRTREIQITPVKKQ